eukprot:8952235-Pyramimonas_sp.AAC.2
MPMSITSSTPFARTVQSSTVQQRSKSVPTRVAAIRNPAGSDRLQPVALRTTSFHQVLRLRSGPAARRSTQLNAAENTAGAGEASATKEELFMVENYGPWIKTVEDATKCISASSEGPSSMHRHSQGIENHRNVVNVGYDNQTGCNLPSPLKQRWGWFFLVSSSYLREKEKREFNLEKAETVFKSLK